MVALNIKSPRTQKAKSVLFGCRTLHANLHHSRIRHVATRTKALTHLIQNHNDIKRITPNFWVNNTKVFARPCPLTPRHGFVESRIVSSNKELSSLLDEVLAIDPEGEIILMSFLNKASVNAILTTSGMLSIGPDHDGATSGKSSFCFAVKPESLQESVLSISGLPSGSSAFIEAVVAPDELNKEVFHITQVRGGPAIAPVNDFIPSSITVTSVVRPNDDLVAWESEVKKFTAGTVVYGPGHTLASHAAIHCVINNIPFITTKEPVVGQVLEPNSDKAPPFNLQQFKLGVTVGLSSLTHMKHMLHVSACVLHNWAYIRNSEHASWLLGLSCAYFVKVMCALNFGEYRHFVDSGKGKSRDNIYKTILTTKRIGYYMRDSVNVIKLFMSPKHARAGYGGPKWGAATKAQVKIWNAMAAVYDKGISPYRVNKLLERLNKAINLVHNNGWLFNKISSQEYLNDIAEKPGLAAFQLSDIFYDNYMKVCNTKHIRNVRTVNLKSKKKKKASKES